MKLNSVVQKNSTKRRRMREREKTYELSSKSIFRGVLAGKKAKTLNSGGS